MKHKILVISCLVCLMFAGFGGPAASAAGALSHPRLYFTSAELTNLKALETAPSHSAIWNGIKTWADSHVSDSAPTEIGSETWTMADTVKQYLDNMCFVYAMTENTTYASSAKTWALSVAGWTDWGCYQTTSIITMGMSFAYDVLYDYLTALERDTIRTAIVARMNPYYETYVGNPGAFRYYPNSGCLIAGGLGIAGLALEGDYAGTSNWIDFAKAVTQAVLGWGGADGGWFEGLNYATSFEYLVSFLDAIKRIKGQDLFNNDFLRQLPYYFIYGTYNNQLLPFEDTEWSDHVILRGTFIYRLASAYGDGHAQWFADQSAAALLSAISYYKYSAMGMYMWKNPNIVAKAPTDLPLTRYFKSIGYVVFRTGWSNSNYVLVFKSGTSVGHAHADQNSWSLFGPVSDGVISGTPGY
ncbi:DUF4962 domain-containing protein, partial [Candidatus Bathyarchaeota archaeon]|nr:DUF4962 domain-containing protein [Candidatus Bathyarchaeota archaeon]